MGYSATSSGLGFETSLEVGTRSLGLRGRRMGFRRLGDACLRLKPAACVCSHLSLFALTTQGLDIYSHYMNRNAMGSRDSSDTTHGGKTDRPPDGVAFKQARKATGKGKKTELGL